MEWMLLPLKRYADFSGRSQRKEYWMFFLGYMIAATVAFVLMVIARPIGGLALAALVLALFVPSLSVQARRFHDQDRSAWMILLNLIPYIGGIVVIVFMCLDGTNGPNRFGKDPKGGHLNQVFA
jgi:uncharacterized membrane protein YhaH (DUF805 family)